MPIIWLLSGNSIGVGMSFTCMVSLSRTKRTSKFAPAFSRTILLQLSQVGVGTLLMAIMRSPFFSPALSAALPGSTAPIASVVLKGDRPMLSRRLATASACGLPAASIIRCAGCFCAVCTSTITLPASNSKMIWVCASEKWRMGLPFTRRIWSPGWKPACAAMLLGYTVPTIGRSS